MPVTVLYPEERQTPDALERQLLRLRKKQAELSVKESTARDLQAQLATREKGLIVADTLPQAQAQLTQILRQAGFQILRLPPRSP